MFRVGKLRPHYFYLLEKKTNKNGVDKVQSNKKNYYFLFYFSTFSFVLCVFFPPLKKFP
jgi:hypothetical protein